MDRIIRQITEHFVSRLPDGEDHYRVEDLKEYNFPSFLVRRIHIELQWNLDESMVLPKTDWANTKSDAVQQSWHQFLSAIHAQVQLPASYAKAVIETAVTDIMDMLLQPRKNITDILFGGQDTLSKAEVEERTELMVVYAHFARVINGYMQRKQQDKLSRKRCKEIIKQVDIKVTAQYTPLQWAQMLDPLFTLAGTELESDLLRLFFEDRNMHRTARRFDEMDKTITRAEFIEVLSSPDLLNYDGYEDDQSKLFADGDKQNQMPDGDGQESDSTSGARVTSSSEEQDDTIQPTDSGDGLAGDTGELPNKDNKKENEDELAEQPPQKEDYGFEKADEEDTKTVHTEPVVEGPDELSDKPESIDEVEKKESSSLNAIYEQEEEKSETVAENEAPIQADVNTDEADNNSAEEESPIWMRFMDSNDEESSAESKNEVAADNEYQEALATGDSNDENGEEERQVLEYLLEDDEDYFVKELFDGSQQAYRQALHEIAQKKSWKEASELIAQNIFERNAVNFYSEPAVDFTDQLHDYFINKQTSNP